MSAGPFHLVDLALDRPPPGWRISNRDRLPAIGAAIGAGEAVTLRVEAGDAAWLAGRITFADNGAWTIRVTDRDVAGDARTLIYHPPVLALGVGAESGVSTDEMVSLVRSSLGVLSPLAVACVASIDTREREPAIHALAALLDAPARFFAAARLAEEEPRLKSPSEIVRRATGCPGVAEGAALAAAGPAANLIVPKTKSAGATCAIARSPVAIDPASVGRPAATT